MHEMARGGVCGKPDGHKGQHLSLSVLEHTQEYMREYYAKNKERILEYQREFYIKNKERVLEYQREFRRERDRKFRELIQTVKLTLGCIDCGYNEHPAMLDFDHVTGTKKFEIGQASKIDRYEVYEEMGKCEVRCKDCHQKITAERRKASNINQKMKP